MKYRAILLDMMQTFMFGNDRFGPEQDYHATYRALGGGALAADQVRGVVDDALARMAADYRRPEFHEGFPVARDYLARALDSQGLPDTELSPLDRVFARHETGEIPEAHARCVRELARTHDLVLVGNVWGDCRGCRDELRRQGMLDLFRGVLLSSEAGMQKPGRAIFDQALALAGVGAREAVMVGDDAELDLRGAAAAGMDGIWINPAGRPVPAGVEPVAELTALTGLPDWLSESSRDG